AREAADVEEEVPVDPHPLLRVRDLRMELNHVALVIEVFGRSHQATRAPGEKRETGRQFLDDVAVARPDPALRGHAGEERPRALDLEHGLAVLTMLARMDATAQVAREELHAVANAQNRNALREHRGWKLGRAGLVHARRPSREDDSLRVERRKRHRVEVRRADLGEDTELPRAPRDQLRELRAEVEDE